MRPTYLLPILIGVMAALAATSCRSDIDEPEPLPAYGSSLANDATVSYGVAALTDIPADFAAALGKRMPLSASAADARVLLLTASALEEHTAQVVDTYRRGGVIVIMEPEAGTVNSWFRQVNMSRRMPAASPAMALYAFGGSSTYMLDLVPDGLEVNEALNEFVEWVNTVLEPKIGSGAASTVADISAAQSITHTRSYTCKVQVAKAWSSAADVVNGKGTVTAVYSVYPLYSFPASGDEGEDYYVVEAEYRVESDNMTNRDKPASLDGNNWWPDDHMWISRHGGCYCRICALYLSSYNVQTELLQGSEGSYSEIPGLVFASTPVPSTSVGSSTYNVNSSWSVGDSQGLSGTTGEGLEYGASYTGSFTYGYSCERDVADVLIGNNQSGAVARFAYNVQNLPQYEYHRERISIRKAPVIALSSAKFPAQWVWRVPGVKVESPERFVLHSRLQVNYGSFHYWTNFKYSKDVHDPLNGPLDFYEELTPPNRTPTGWLEIQNTTADQWITEVTVQYLGLDEPVYQQHSGSTAPGSTFSCNLPTGQYRVTMKMSKRGEDKKLYKLSAGSINIQFASPTTLQADYSFMPQ